MWMASSRFFWIRRSDAAESFGRKVAFSLRSTSSCVWRTFSAFRRCTSSILSLRGLRSRVGSALFALCRPPRLICGWNVNSETSLSSRSDLAFARILFLWSASWCKRSNICSAVSSYSKAESRVFSPTTFSFPPRRLLSAVAEVLGRNVHSFISSASCICFALPLSANLRLCCEAHMAARFSRDMLFLLLVVVLLVPPPGC
mmetsp:Transcript_28066/g.71125  ORF Transcript_28066/g.71125 Transcript_28066/m.71125 type:complete len:201 (+) Transcript_28066:1627-2229(+)